MLGQKGRWQQELSLSGVSVVVELEEGRVEAGTACPGEAQDHAEEGQGPGVDPGEVVVVVEAEQRSLRRARRTWMPRWTPT